MTTQRNASQISIILIACFALSCAAKLQAQSIFNVTSGSWNLAANWSPTGIPGASTNVIIPAGKTVTGLGAIQSCASLSIGGFLTVDNGLTVSGATIVSNAAIISFSNTTGTRTFGDFTVQSGGTNTITSANGSICTFSGNVTNNGTWNAASAGQSCLITFSGANKAIAGTGVYTNQGVSVSGTYTIQPGVQFFTGINSAGSGSLGGTGSLTNQGTIYHRTTAFPTVIVLDCSTVGNTLIWSNINGTITPRSIPYYNLTLGNTGSSGDNLNGSGLTIAGNLTAGGSGNVASWPLNNIIGGSLIYTTSSSTAATFPAAFSIGGLNQTSGTLTVPSSGILTNSGSWTRSGGTFNAGTGGTVRFTGTNAAIGGSTVTTFVNLFVDTNAVVTLNNASTVSGTLTITNGGTFNAAANATGGGAFTLRAGGTLGIGSAAGISSTASTGSVQLAGTRTYEAGASYIYNGTVAQVTGNALTTVANGIKNLIISNAAGVTLTGNASVTNDLIVSAGTLALGANTVTLGASAAVFSSGTIQGSLTTGASGLVYAGTDGGFGTNIISTNLTMTSGSTLNMDVGATAAGANDLLIVSNTLALNGTVINLKAPSVGATIDQAVDYILVTAGNITGTPTLNWVTAPANSANYALIVTPTSVNLHFGAAVPVGSLAFTQQPTSTGAGTPISPAVTVLVEDSGNNPLTNVIVTLSVSNAAAALNGSVTQISDVTGTATFSNLSINPLGTYTLQVVAGTPPSTNYSSAFTIGAGPANKLAIVTQPASTAAAGVAFGTQPVAVVEDALGNIETNSTAPILATASSGNLQGTTLVNADGVTGQAAFSGLYATNAGNITLTFASTGLASVTSSAITVSPTTAAAMIIVTNAPATATAGVAFTNSPSVVLVDQYGNTNTSVAAVTVSASSGNLLGTANVNTVGGLAKFSGLSLTNTGSVTLTFASSGLPSVNSSAITVNAGPITQIAWLTQPGAGLSIYGNPFGIQPVLATEDQYGNPSTNGLLASVPVTITQTGGSGTLIGTTTYDLGTSVSNGVATCTGLGIDGTNADMQLTASSTAGYGSPVAGMSVWLDANDSTTITGASPVTKWSDKSGNHFDFGVAAGSGTITYANSLNGRKVVTFPNGPALLTTNNDYTFTGNSMTLFCVVRHASTAFNTYEGPFSSTSGGNDWNTTTSWSIDSGSPSTTRFQRNSTAVQSPSGLVVSTPVIWEGAFNNAGNLQYVGFNTGSVSNETSGTPSTLANFNISQLAVGARMNGVGALGNAWNGDVAEVLLYPTFLVATNRSAVESYLYNKWLNASAPSFASLASAASATFAVTPAPVTITAGLFVTPKFYDGTTTATLITNSSLTLFGVIPTDTNNVSLDLSSYTANFDEVGPDTNIPVTVSGLDLIGSAAAFYTLIQPTSLTGTINPPLPTYSAYTISAASTTPTAGVGDQLIITAVNGDGSTQTGLNADVYLTFSGLSASPSGGPATVTDKTGMAWNFGQPTLVTFVNGVSAAGGNLMAYNAATSAIHVTDGTYNDGLAGGSTVSLMVSPSADSAYRLTGTGSPQVGVNYNVNVTLVDQYQNVSGFTGSKSLTFDAAMSPGADGSVATVNGVAQLTAAPASLTAGLGSVVLVAHKAESGKTLTVTDGSLSTTTPGGASLALGTITPSPATQLVIITQPSATASAGLALATQPVLTAVDLYDNVAATNAQVTATSSIGNLQGTTVINAVNGTATYSGLFLTNVGSITLSFTSPGLTATNSAAILVGTGPVSQLGWVTQPGTGLSEYDTAFGTQPVLQTEDQYGNFSTNGLAPSMIVAITQTGGSGTLVGMTSYDIGSSASNGTVTCTGLGVRGTGTNMVLTATVPAAYGSPVSGMSFWLDASVASSVVTNGTGSVISWLDQSGNGIDFTNVLTAGTGGNGIQYVDNVVNGRKAVTFGATSGGNATELETLAYGNTGNNSVSVFVAAKKRVSGNGTGGTQRVFATAVNGTDDYNSLASFEIDYGGGGVTPLVFRQNGNRSQVAFDPSTTWHTFEYIANASSNVVYINTIAGGTLTGNLGTSAVGNFAMNRASVGGGIAAGGGIQSPFDGDIAEVLVYNSALSLADRQAVETYLANKWQTNTYAPVLGVSATFTVSPLPVILVGSRAYDGTTNAQAGILSVANEAVGDDVTVASGLGGLAGIGIGSQAITSFGDLALGGVTGTNYTLSGASGSVTITQALPSIVVASSENPSGFEDSVTFTATLPSDATGSVVFETNGIALSTDPLTSGVAQSDATTLLPRGDNIVTVVYLGDANYMAATNSLVGGQVVTNHPPVAGAASYSRSPGASLTILISDLLTHASDVDGDPLTLLGVGTDGLNLTTANGVSLATDGTSITYPGAGSANVNDSFEYTVGDGQGGTAMGMVAITVLNYSNLGTNSISLAGTTAAISIEGIPNFTYVLQTTTDLNLPWTSIATNTSDTNGLLSFIDTNATNGQQFYRTAQH